MPMELYSSEALVRDIVNAISSSEGKPLNIGGNHHEGIDRSYLFELVSEAKKAVEGHAAVQKKPVVRRIPRGVRSGSRAPARGT
jgi:hypothetical protein